MLNARYRLYIQPALVKRRGSLKLKLGFLLFFLRLPFLGLHCSMFSNHIRKSLLLMIPSFGSLLFRLFLIMQRP